MNLLEVKDLRTYLFTRWGTVKAVDGVTFSLRETEVLGLVGESGCGKSMTCLSILRLLPPAGRIVGGQVLLRGDDLLKKSEAEMQKIRGTRLSLILQDATSSLNPVFTIGNQLTEAITVGSGLTGKSAKERAVEMLKMVRIPSPEVQLRNYPHELSGGMRQRVVAAIALSSKLDLLIADEPTSSLDATTQLQFLHLLKELQQQVGLTVIFVTHDLGIVARMCTSLAIMYAGKVVEMGDVRELLNCPQHPYTEALMKSVPQVEEKVERLPSIEGEPPRLYDVPLGCAFAPRCLYAMSKCREHYPPQVEISDRHLVSCWKYV